MPVTSGTVFGNPVQVLRDTGCSTVVVKRDLVPADRLTGNMIVCVLIDGTARRTPVAMTDVDTPFLRGQLRLCVCASPCMTCLLYTSDAADE